MENNEFYIGWQPKSPASFAKHVKKVLLVLLPLGVVAGMLLSSSQKKFSTSSFEFGQLVEVKGVYRQYPVPSLYITSSKDALGRAAFITIPLVGYGKHGAEGAIKKLEEEKHTSFNNKIITIKGTLLYSDGKTLLQVDVNDKPLVALSEAAVASNLHVTKELGMQQLKGEILDPKCYFGVMKPGHGKPHRDCAIRCIEGGISPVFSVQNEKGERDYYLLLGPNGEKINSQVKDLIADPVQLTARAIKYDDWIVLYVDPAKDIKRISGISLVKGHDAAISCGY